MTLIDIFTNKIEEIFSNEDLPEKIAVAVSGGADSLSLAMLLQQFCFQKKIEIFAVTIDHKMRSESSQEAEDLARIMQKQQINHQILSINSTNIPQSNIEAKLRESRYEILYDYCLKNKIKYLFLGHQLDDVAENFLIRLFRGSGLDGLSTMAEFSNFKKIKLVRPLLNIEKGSLKNFLQNENIEWFEDKTNEDEKFLRNKIRNFLTSFDDKSLIQNRIKHATDEISNMRDMFDDLMLDEAKKILEIRRGRGKFYFSINRDALLKCDKKFALKILALAAMEVSGKAYKPRLKDLKNFYLYIIVNSPIKRRDFYGCFIEQGDKQYISLKSQKEQSVLELRTALKKIL